MWINKKIRLFIWLLTIALAFADLSWAAELHVGSGQTYLTIASAISASGSDDVIIIHAGTYNEYNLSPKTSTTLQKASGESSPLIDGQQSTCSQNPIFDMNSVNNVVFDGLIVTGGGTHFRGNWFIGYSGVCNNITIKNCETYIDGVCAGADNPAVIALYDCDNCIIEDTNIYGLNITAEMSNQPNGILIWKNNQSPTIENCEIHDTYSIGIYNKHTSGDQSITVRYNYFYNVKIGIVINGNYSTVEHNLVVASTEGVRSYDNIGDQGGSNTTYQHNTFYGCDNGMTLPKSATGLLYDVTFKDNIVHEYGGSDLRGLNIRAYGSSYSHNFTVHHNLYYSSTLNDIVKEFGPTYNLTEWQAKGYGSGSLNSAPTFVGGASPSSILDYALATGSVGENAASDGTDMGADMGLVGVDAEGGDSSSGSILYGITITGGQFN